MNGFAAVRRHSAAQAGMPLAGPDAGGTINSANCRSGGPIPARIMGGLAWNAGRRLGNSPGLRKKYSRNFWDLIRIFYRMFTPDRLS
jgi:hypothetical protein